MWGQLLWRHSIPNTPSQWGLRNNWSAQRTNEGLCACHSARDALSWQHKEIWPAIHSHTGHSLAMICWRLNCLLRWLYQLSRGLTFRSVNRRIISDAANPTPCERTRAQADIYCCANKLIHLRPLAADTYPELPRHIAHSFVCCPHQRLQLELLQLQ